MTTILAADIGGTNSRFALFSHLGSKLALEASVWLKTQDAASFEVLLDMVWDSDLPIGPKDYDVAVFGVPGPVRNASQCPELANIPWSINLDRIAEMGRASLINDFVAQAYACLTSILDDALVIREGEPAAQGTVAVIGAGTGLGASSLVSTPMGRLGLASEFGHTMFPFTGEREADYESFIVSRTGKRWADGDSVLSGAGLSHLHAFLTGEELAPEAISEKLTIDCETNQWFARLYGRACRNWVLSNVALGGLVITGGVAGKNPLSVQSSYFSDEFLRTHVYADLLKAIPITLNNHADSGLFGAAYHGTQLLNA